MTDYDDYTNLKILEKPPLNTLWVKVPSKWLMVGSKDGEHFEVIEVEMKTVEDVEPVRHGAWKEVLAGMDYEYECTRCKACVEQKYTYCPNCGARMDEQE